MLILSHGQQEYCNALLAYNWLLHKRKRDRQKVSLGPQKYGKNKGGMVMHMVMFTLYYGDYQFTAELDTGAEVGTQQVTIWYSEKTDIENITLAHFSIETLLQSLKEPEHTQLTKQWNEARTLQKKLIEAEIEELRQPYSSSLQWQNKKLPSHIRRQIKNLRQQITAKLQHLEREFIYNELMPLERSAFDSLILKKNNTHYTGNHFLRSFYFEEKEYNYIRDFCQKFAFNSEYQQEVLTGNCHWTKRNELFARNLPLLLNDERAASDAEYYYQQAHELFSWLDEHTEKILGLPEYQYLKAIDSRFHPFGAEQDPLIQPAISLLNQIPGVKTRFSCQGVSGKIHFLGRDVLAVSAHEEFAYVAFDHISYFFMDAIMPLLPKFPTITITPLHHNFALRLVLHSTGDNIRFRSDLTRLTRIILDQLGQNKAVKETQSDLKTTLNWEHPILPTRKPATADPAGLIPGRLSWLCQKEQIENTLHLLYHLNHWAKAFEYLRYADRQGLYNIKTAILQQAHKEGNIQAIAYIDGISHFARGYNIEQSSIDAADVFLEHLEELMVRNKIYPENQEQEQDPQERATRQLYENIKKEVGKDLMECLQEQRHKYTTNSIRNRLRQLVDKARFTRRAIKEQDLEALFVGPTSLLDIPHYLDHWDELDQGDRNKLDPEGSSLIAFTYRSKTAVYRFHLPYRTAACFLSRNELRHLQASTEGQRERGERYGRPISEEESIKYPIEWILDELGVNIEHICPYKLQRKKSELRMEQTWYDSDWEQEEIDLAEDYPDDEKKIYYLPHKRSLTACPVCQQEITSTGQARVEHWQDAHAEQDLTAIHVAWIFGKQKSEMRTITIPPDYRSRATENKHAKTRFWKLSTLQAEVNKHQEGINKED